MLASRGYLGTRKTVKLVALGEDVAFLALASGASGSDSKS